MQCLTYDLRTSPRLTWILDLTHPTIIYPTEPIHPTMIYPLDHIHQLLVARRHLMYRSVHSRVSTWMLKEVGSKCVAKTDAEVQQGQHPE
jgi:hypothetical protein